MKFGVTYFGSRILEHVVGDLKKIRNAGFTYVIHTFSEYDLEFHAGNMHDIVSATRDLGLEAHLNPWGVGNVFGGEPYSNFVSQHFLDSCQVLDDGRVIPMACPNAPAFRNYMRSWVDTVIGFRADAVFWDEPHFHQQGFLSSVPGKWGCRCPHCLRKFESMFGYPLPETENQDVSLFRTASLKEFLTELMSPLNENGLKNILYLTANLPPEKALKEWRHLADMQDLDSISTGPYWMWHRKPIESVSDFSEVLLKIAAEFNLEPQIWIQCAKILRGREQEIGTAVDLAVISGMKNLAFWGFEGCAHESWISCEDPTAAWEVCLRTVKDYLV